MKKLIVLASLAWVGMAFGTRVHHETVSCGSCAKKTDVAELGSSNEMGSKDLDLRPAPMMRETVSLWLQECPSCEWRCVNVSVRNGGYKVRNVRH